MKALLCIYLQNAVKCVLGIFFLRLFFFLPAFAEVEKDLGKRVHHKLAAGLGATVSALKLDNLISVWCVHLA